MNRVGAAGQLQWLQGDAAPILPWRCDWPGADEQQLVDDYTAYLSPYLLTLQRLDDALRERMEQLAVQQFDLIDYVLPLLPEVLDPGRMEVARVKAWKGNAR